MTAAFDLTTDVPAVSGAGARITLLHGSSFCISETTGDIDPTLPQGLFFRDRRVLSSLRLLLDGVPLEPLAAHAVQPYAGVFVGRGRSIPGHMDSGLVVRRDRWVGNGLREDVTVTNYRHTPASGRLTLRLDADFANLFAVKAGENATTTGAGAPLCEVTDGRLVLRSDDGPLAMAVVLHGFPEPDGREVSLDVRLPPGGSWQGCVEIVPLVDGKEAGPDFRCGDPVEHAAPASSLRAWRRRVPVVESEPPSIERVVWRSQEDLGSLRLVDPARPGEVTVAAGAPWYMTLFGRDSLLTSWFALIVDPRLALGTLKALARLQGERVVPETEEQPGRIPHELRSSGLPFGGVDPDQTTSVYYGTVDATPLFVMLLGELQRWGLAEADVRALLPHADRALEWMTTYGDPDGDGFVEYERMTPDGLRNQGWKDSWDGVRAADGRLGEGAIALAEVQGYAYAAYLARAKFAQQDGDAELARSWRERARALRAAFNERFWLPDRGWFAMGLDGDKRPLDALTSTIGHCLWTGIADVDKAARVAEHLVSPELFNGWGTRTLATSMTGYNPVSYHNGSVWPHDTALVAAGLMRYGHVDAALTLVNGLLDSAAAFDDRLPELFGGLDRSELSVPLTYPASCSPQAWAAAAPLLLLRTVLRLDPEMRARRIRIAPVLPHGITRLSVHGIPLGDAHFDVLVDGSGTTVSGLPDAVEVISEPRPPLAEEV